MSPAGRSRFDKLTVSGICEPLALSLPVLSKAEGSKGSAARMKGA